jgi:DNA repair protein RecO (recombination protein O)
MIQRIEGIVLRTVRYQDSALVVALYTREHGRVDVMVRGARGSTMGSKRGRQAALQPMTVIEATLYQRQGRELQHLSESQVAHPWRTLDVHPVRALYGMLCTELMLRAVAEPEPNRALYHFYRATLEALDGAEHGWYDLTVHFAVHLTRYLGFFPNAAEIPSNSPVAFHPEDGHFASVPEVNPIDSALLAVAQADELNPTALQLRGAERKALLELILRTYQLHVAGFAMPRSLEVFEAIFS